MKKLIYLSACIFSFKTTTAQLPKLGKNSNAEIIKAMSVEEKARLVMGLGLVIPGFTDEDKLPPDGKPYTPPDGLAGFTFAIPRLGIPAIVLTDGPAGMRVFPKRANDNATYYCTAFPIGTLLASSWDESSVKKVGLAIGNEVKEYGADVILAPGTNIQRNPLGGRNFEYFSEDPLVSGKTAAAYINGVQQNGTGTSIKHFAANNHETNRNKIDVQVSQRALREIYLRGFEIAASASKPWTIMSSYNKINGTYTSQHYDLITTILQKEWNYNGLVMTDWFGGDDGAAQMNAGNHLIMPGSKLQYGQILAAIKNGNLKMSVLDANVDKVLNLILQSNTFKRYKYSNKPNLAANAVVAKDAAAAGFVLLKNEHNTLPVKAGAVKIALFGNSSYNTITGGTGSGDVYEAYSISIADGLGKNYSVNKDLQQQYKAYLIEELKKIKEPAMFLLPRDVPPEKIITETEAAELANNCDAAFLTIGRTSGEFADHKLENHFYLNQTEKNNLSVISKAFRAKNKKMIVLLNIGGVIEINSWKDMADAILLVWQPGQEGGNAIKDIISGATNPSGKLATTFMVDYADAASSNGFPGTPAEMPVKIEYNDGIYVGYRYYEKFKVPVLYEFGYGLSYTDFTYSNIKLSSAAFTGKIIVTADITNSGKVAGKEVVQLYLAAPVLQLHKPVKELKGFVKTILLQPGQKQTVSFTINKMDLASFSEEQSAWVADKGVYSIFINASSQVNKLTATFTLPNELLVKKVNNVMVPAQKIEELK